MGVKDSGIVLLYSIKTCWVSFVKYMQYMVHIWDLSLSLPQIHNHHVWMGSLSLHLDNGVVSVTSSNFENK